MRPRTPTTAADFPENLHFIGIGGAGMVGLALIMHEKGYSVTGSDMAVNSNTRLLAKNGITIAEGHRPDNIPKLSKGQLLVIRSSAVNDQNPELRAAVNSGHQCILRGGMLAKVASTYAKTVAVAGSHGKTSVTALLVHILKSSELNPGYMIGGKVSSWEAPAAAGDGTLFITESDESDGTQVHLKSNILLITNIEDDHSWTLGGKDVLMANFAKIAANAQKVIFNHSESTNSLLGFHSNKKAVFLQPENLADKQDWGSFQKENANLAAVGAIELGIDPETAFCEVRRFPGVERRMSIRYQQNNLILIEDYAHHPTEVRAAIAGIRELFPDYRLLVIFQPHRYARLERYINEFALELKQADRVKIVPVFSAWTETGPVNSANLAELIGEKAEFLDGNWSETARRSVEEIVCPAILAVFGAGDIEDLIPELIREIKKSKRQSEAKILIFE